MALLKLRKLKDGFGQNGSPRFWPRRPTGGGVNNINFAMINPGHAWLEIAKNA
jgi:hypothetical protein